MFCSSNFIVLSAHFFSILFIFHVASTTRFSRLNAKGILEYTISALIFGALGIISVLSVLYEKGKSSFNFTDCLFSTYLFLDVSALSQIISLLVREMIKRKDF